jgi:hypothetical protein
MKVVIQFRCWNIDFEQPAGLEDEQRTRGTVRFVGGRWKGDVKCQQHAR